MTNGGAAIILAPVLGANCENLGKVRRRRERIIHYGALASPIASHSVYDLAPKFLSISGFAIYGYSGSDVLGVHSYEGAIQETVRFIEAGIELWVHNEQLAGVR